MEKTVFITMFHPLSSRNFFTTETLAIVKTIPRTQFIFFVDDYKLEFFNKNYSSPQFIFVPVNIKSLKESKHQKILFNCLQIFFPTLAVHHRLRERLLSQNNYKNKFVVALNFILGRSIGRLKVFRSLLRYLDRKTFKAPASLDLYFQKYMPQSLFITDVFNEIEGIFHLTALKYSIPALAMVRSWDNTTNKGLMRQIPDYTLTNNPIIKEEATSYHDVPASSIFPMGFPQFDDAFKSNFMPREKYFSLLNLDPKKKLVLFSPAGQQISDTDWQICEILKQGQAQGKIPSDLQFLIRSHPLDPARLTKFEPTANFYIDTPGVKFGPREKVTELLVSDQQHLMNSLYNCDILLNITSTISLDCLPFNKPQILISFDGWEKKKYIESICHFQTDEHFIRLVESKALSVTHNAEELYTAINKYLQDPLADETYRKNTLRQQIWNLSGDAGIRVGQALTSFFTNEKIHE